MGRSTGTVARVNHIMTLVSAYGEARKQAGGYRALAELATDAVEAARYTRLAEDYANKAARMHQMIRSNILYSLQAAADGKL